MWTAAEVGKCAVGVERDSAILKVGDKLNLVLVALLGEGLKCVGLRYLGTYELLLVA